MVRSREPFDIFHLVETDANEKTRSFYVIVDFKGDYRSGTVQAGDALGPRWVSSRHLPCYKVRFSTLRLLKKGWLHSLGCYDRTILC